MCKVWDDWAVVLLVVRPESVIRWLCVSEGAFPPCREHPRGRWQSDLVS